ILFLGVLTVNRLNELLQEFRNLKNRDSSACSPANPNPVIAIALVNKLKVGNENPDRLAQLRIDFRVLFVQRMEPTIHLSYGIGQNDYFLFKGRRYDLHVCRKPIGKKTTL
ncbi:hypothetical protein AHF37_08417, partial [Paragonimus kellicotti]